ncbi:MAG TPA: S41 family peptidase [Bacteroidales bacterium]|nr:S41 family peptidase [Bacteroidales bacterium]
MKNCKIHSSFFIKLTRNIFLFVLLSLFLSFSPDCNSQETDNNFETVKNLDIFYSLYKELNLYYVDPIVPGEIIKKGIEGMLKSLDPYTVYIPESQIEDIKFITTGQYGGIGAVIRKAGEYTVIVQPYENSPAAVVGILPGDVIVEIDSKSVKEMPSDQVSELLRGEPETSVKLGIQRPGVEDIMSFTVIRKEIKRNSVPFFGLADEKIGYIALDDFTNTAAKEVQEAFISLKQDYDINALILDLRGNPGGLLVEAVKICNLFVPKGEQIVSTKGKVAQWDKTYTSSAEPIDTQIKIVVLVNRGSASASEIVAGAIQDLDRGVILGQRTFGKGLVQTTRDLSYNGILKVTTAKYYIPSGRCIQALDYSNRNEDGSVGNIPDSLISEFKTKNGRKVYDGGGITPDIVIEPELLSNIATSLIIKNLIFDYAVFYKSTHPEISTANEFVFTDTDYQNFITWVKDKDFDYETKSEEYLRLLVETSKEEKYYDQASSELESLMSKFTHDKNKDIMIFKEEIKDLISQEIVVKYYYEKGAIMYGLKNDPEVREAVRVIKNDQDYKDLLIP